MYGTSAANPQNWWDAGEDTGGRMNVAAGTVYDDITAAGNIAITGSPKLSHRWAETDMRNTAENTVWDLMKSDGKMTGAVNSNWYADPNTKVVMDVSINGDEKILRAIKQPNKP